MINLVKIELKKMYHNKLFCITLIGVTLLLVVDAILSIITYYDILNNFSGFAEENQLNSQNLSLQANSLYSSWIGGRANGLIPTLFYFLLSVFAVLPYSCSYYSEQKSGYIRSVVTRVGKTKYFLAKYISVLISGMAIILIPILVNFILVACFIPAQKPEILNDLMLQVFSHQMWSSIFYTKPLLYDLLFIALPALYAGIWATVSLAVSLFAKNRFVILFIPFIVMLFVAHIVFQLQAFKSYIEVNPINYLRGVASCLDSNAYVVFGEILVLAISAFAIFMGVGKKNDVF